MRLRLVAVYTLLVVLGLAAVSGGFPRVPSKVSGDLADLRPEQVAFVRYIPAGPPMSWVQRPLYGGRPGDRPWIGKLLQGLASAQPAGPPGPKTWQKRVAWTEVEWVNRRRIRIRDAMDCQTEGNRTSCRRAPGQMVIAEGEQEQVVTAPELAGFLHQELERAMPLVEQYRIEPRHPLIGGRLTVQGDGWAGATSFRLELEQKGGRQIELAAGAVTFGAFRWTGWVPRHLQPGEYTLRLHVEPGAKIARPVTLEAAHP